MITKEQALEFIYDLSKHYEVCLDLTGETFSLGICPYINWFSNADYEFTHEEYVTSSEDIKDLVKKFIQEYPKTVSVLDKVPVDIDMLEIGKTYKIFYQKEGFNKGFLKGVLTGFEDMTDCNDQDICVFNDVKITRTNMITVEQINSEELQVNV